MSNSYFRIIFVPNMFAILLTIAVATFAARHGFAHLITRDEIETKQCYDRICWGGKEDYPEQQITDLIYNDDYSLRTLGSYTPDYDDSSSVPQSCNLCSHVISKRVSPLTLDDQDGSRYFVVRTQNYQQFITLNICEPEDVQKSESRCMDPAVLEYRPQGEKRECKQKTTTIRLLVYNLNENKFQGKTLQYPSACICTVMRSDS